MTPPIFCVAPWVNAYRGTDGFRSLCAISKDRSAAHADFESWWNGEEIRAARVSLLQGQVPDQCRACVRSNRTAGQGYNQWFNRRFGTSWPDILENTNALGFTQVKPLAMDYRTSHCNLRCRSCDARHSSSIRAETIRHGEVPPPQAGRADGKEWHDDGMLESIEHVYWAGGEPFMSPDHRRLMRQFLDSGRAGDITVHYTSNMMHFDTKVLAELIEYSQRFRSVGIGASIDGTGLTGAYVRTGWGEADFLRHVNLVLTHAPKIEIFFDCTLTNMGLLDLRQIFRLAAERRLNLSCKLMERNGVNEFLHVDLLQRDAVMAALGQVSLSDLPRPIHQAVKSVQELLERRYCAQQWSSREAVQLQRSEARRGMAGFFMERVGPHLNRPITS